MTNPFLVLQNVADAVVGELNNAAAGTFSMAFNAARTYDTELKLEEDAAKALSVQVLYGVPEVEMVTTSRFSVHCPVEVAVRKQCLVTNTAGIDSLVSLAGEVYAYLASNASAGNPRVLADYTTACWEDVEGETNQPVPYDPDLLKESNQFASVLRFRYVVHA
jgi:hypothetical protein